MGIRPASPIHTFIKARAQSLALPCLLGLALATASLSVPEARAACGANNRVWDGSSSTAWNTAANWTAANVPNATTENAIIASATRVPVLGLSTSIGCFELQSGTARANTNAINLSITGDYFKNLNAGSLTVTSGVTFTLLMAGTAPQTLDNQDTLNYLTVSNNTSVTFPSPFQIRNTFSITGTGTTIYINGNLTLAATTTWTIPASVTVEVGPGATLTAKGGITLNGTLRIKPGASVIIGSAKSLLVNSPSGLLSLEGASGNVATLDGDGGATFIATVTGAVNANYFRISHLTAAGLNVTSGTIQAMDNGGFYYIATAGTAITLGATAVAPGTMANVGFYDSSAFGNNTSFIATTYTGGVVTVNNWSGLGCTGATTCANETDAGNKIYWGAQAGTELTLSNNTAAGNPTTTIAANTGPILFGTFAFGLNQSSSATDITSVTLTQYGTASTSDVSYIQVFKDVNGNCAYNAGIDTQIGTNLTLSGSPATATISIPAADVTTDSTTPGCIHVLARTSATAGSGNTIGFGITSTSDVTNSQAYSFSATSGPPVSAPSSTITGTLSRWDGSSSTAWATTGNWTPATLPSSTRDCDIGSGVRIPAVIANVACRNTTLLTGGTLNFSGATWQLQSYGSLVGQTGFTFQNATTANLVMKGTSNQTLSLATAFTGNLLIQNTGTTGSNIINVDGDTTINGTLTVTSGVLKVNDGVTLTVLGNTTVQTGATLEIAPGGTLAMGDGTTLTIDSGGFLTLQGTSAKISSITSALTTPATGYTVVVNGTIAAQYYAFSKVAINGVTINAGATIDSTSHLQDGSFTYPVVNSTTFLKLYRQIPTDTMDYMTFDNGASSATGITNIYTSAAAGTLTLDSYTGTWSGPSYSDGATYLLSWTGATNTLDLSQESTSPTNVNQGTTYTMGKFGFKQTTAGASFSNTDITSIKLTLTGTGTASDVTATRIYYDSACSGSAGTLIGTGTFSGNPATVTFSGITGATVAAHATTPPKVCVYVEYDIAAAAVNANTVGVKINAPADVDNSMTYAISGSTPPPITLGTSSTVVGTTTTWLGTTSTNWCTASNWNGGVPTSALNCNISAATFNPTVNGTTCAVATCKTATVSTGTLTVSAGGTLNVYGSFTNTGTLVQSGTFKIMDDGVNPTNQTITPGNSGLGTFTFDKTAGGTVIASGNAVTISTLTFPGGSNFEWQVPNATTLTLTNGVTIPSGITFTVQQGGILEIPNGQSIAVTGGTFKMTGTNEVAPTFTVANKSKVTISGAGKWGFSASSGTIDLTGFILDYIDENGINLTGSSALSNFDGGQFTNLSNTYGSVNAIQINTTGSIPAVATNVGWNWGPNNTPPAPGTTYYLASSTGCASQSIAFDQWYGDFFVALLAPDTTTKVSATNCNISIAASASPVSLLSLTATPYNNTVAIDWTTASELDHAGFNVYRSILPGSGFVQVNSSLIRNFSFSGIHHGGYRYVDNDVSNDITYYYQIEDVATNGQRTLHGPLEATPYSHLSSTPATANGTNLGTSTPGAGTGNGAASGNIATPLLADLGNGVHILSKTRHSVRLEIIPPTATFSTSSWDAAYQTLSVPGYSSILDAGKPELVERMLLIEVDPDLQSASVTNAIIQEAGPSSHNLAPVPSWTPNGSGILEPSWSPDSAAYASTSYSPSAYYSLHPSTESIGGKTFLKINVTPFIYKANSEQTKNATKITLDIGLDGGAWAGQPAPTGAAALIPSAVENTLRIRYKTDGVYQLSYDDLAAAAVDGPFFGASSALFRLYYLGVEIPLEVHDTDGIFVSGDSIRFYAPYVRNTEDDENEVVLSQVALADSVGAPLRIPSVDATPSGQPETDEQGTLRSSVAEVDNYPMFNTPLGAELDHFYWKRLFREKGQPATADSSLAVPLDLPDLLTSGVDPVRLKIHVKGDAAFAVNATHHLGITVNAMPFQAADIAFDRQDATVLTVDVAASFFIAGVNLVQLEALADLVPDGDWDMFYIDRIEASYRSDRMANDGIARIINSRPDALLTVRGFSDPASIGVYDITTLDEIKSLSIPAATSIDGGATYQIQFAAVSGDDGYLGRKLIAFETTGLPLPTSLSLGRGHVRHLRDSSSGADMLIVGPAELITAAKSLIDARQAQGLRVVTAPLDQIYAEFSHGLRRSQAVRDFILYSRSNWVAPAPKYLLFLGDATYDPRNRLGYDVSASSAMPVPLENGLYLDYGGDNWFVKADDGSSLPLMAVGRIPTSNPVKLTAYLNKVLAYESGTRAPAGSNGKKLFFVSDTDHMNEKFAQNSNSLASAAVSAYSGFSTSQIDRTLAGSDATTKSAIISAFNSGALAVTYLGHGAEDRWADAAVFLNSDADALTNTQLPIVLGLNCLNAYFYDADPTYESLAERMIFNSAGGAVAFWGSTTLTLPTAQLALANNFFDHLGQETRQTEHTVRLGDLILTAKAALGSNTSTNDVLGSYTLIGDPSMRLPASSFATAAPATTPAPADTSDDQKSSGGFLGCGTMNDQGRGGRGPGGGSTAAILEFALLALMIAGSRRLVGAVNPTWDIAV